MGQNFAICKQCQKYPVGSFSVKTICKPFVSIVNLVHMLHANKNIVTTGIFKG